MTRHKNLKILMTQSSSYLVLIGHYESLYKIYCIQIKQAQQTFQLVIQLFICFKNKFKGNTLDRDFIYNLLIKVTMGWEWFWKKSEDENSQQNENNQTPSTHTKTYYKQYSSERACVPDEEDQNYLICTQKINDGNDTYENKERVPVDQGYNSSVRSFRSSFVQGDPNVPNTNIPEYFNPSSFQKQFEELNNFFTTFMSFPLGMPLGAFIQPNTATNTDNFYGMPYRNIYGNQQAPRQTQKKPQNKKNRYFFSQKDKDYDIKDI